MMLDKTSTPPPWLPHTHVRFSYSDFGLEQAVGAIKARVQEGGGSITPLTALKRAELSRQETQYLKERGQLRSPAGHETVRQKTSELFGAIARLCGEVNAGGHVAIQVTSDAAEQCHLRNNRVSLTVALVDSYSEPTLIVREYNKRLPLVGERISYLHGEPKTLCESRFLPDMNRARECGWTDRQRTATFLSTDALADNIVGRFVDLAAKGDRGQLNTPIRSTRRVRARFEGF